MNSTAHRVDTRNPGGRSLLPTMLLATWALAVISLSGCGDEWAVEIHNGTLQLAVSGIPDVGVDELWEGRVQDGAFVASWDLTPEESRSDYHPESFWIEDTSSVLGVHAGYEDDDWLRLEQLHIEIDERGEAEVRPATLSYWRAEVIDEPEWDEPSGIEMEIDAGDDECQATYESRRSGVVECVLGSLWIDQVEVQGDLLVEVSWEATGMPRLERL